MDEEVSCWLCGSDLVAKEVVTVNNEVKIFITCDSCFTDLIVIDKGR
jgi:hypothetical protein